MRHQALSQVALMLSVLLAVAAPARAGTITFADLVQTVGANAQVRPATEVRLRLMSQGGRGAGQNPSAQGGATSLQQQTATSDTSTVQSGATAPDATLSQSGGQVETVDLGDVTGTVCDCGEIPLPPAPPGGGFPWWTLAGIPLICVTGICFDNDDNPPNIPPTPPPPTPPPPQIPEPTTLLLFGSGLLALGARARRRHVRRRVEEETANTAEEV